MSVFGTQIIKNGKVIRHSKNLRGILDYARVSPVFAVTTRKGENPVNGLLCVVYSDGAECTAHFASHAILIDWVRNRRIFQGAKIAHMDGEMGYFTKPGIIGGEK